MNDALKEQVLSALEKIKTEADTLIAERDALKHALRKAQDACQRLREERDAAKIELQTQKAVSRRINNMMKIDIDLPATFTPALGASPRTREDFAACQVGTQIQFREEKIRWEKRPSGLWAYDNSNVLTHSDAEMASHFVDWEKRITLLPLARKAEASSVIRKGQKIDTPAQYDALPPGSRVRKADGQHWQKCQDGSWRVGFEQMRDLAFPRTVLRIGYDDTAVSFDVAGVALNRDKPALRVGDMCSGKGYAALPVGSLVAYSGNRDTEPEESWHKVGVDSWRDVSGRLSIDLCSDARMAMERTPRKIKRIGPEPAEKPEVRVGDVLRTVEDYERAPIGTRVGYYGENNSERMYWEKTATNKWEDRDPIDQHTARGDLIMSQAPTERRVTHVPARFHVGQVISTREEYEALPVGSTVWPCDTRKDWWFTRMADGYVCDGPVTYGFNEMQARDADGRRTIRSLP